MVDAPTCKICGHAHWLREPHQWGRSAGKAPALAAAKAAVKPKASSPRGTSTPPTAKGRRAVAPKLDAPAASSSRGRPKTVDNRKAYKAQKERERRSAKAKATP